MKPTPKTSIALCTYNGEAFLPEQLDSFSAQTLLPDELIVCDDGSTDGTINLLTQYATNAPFPVAIYHNPSNLGSTRNFAKAVALCCGDIVFLADQDDVWRRDKVYAVLAEFGRHPTVGLVFSNATLVDAMRRPLGQRLWENLNFRMKGTEQDAPINLFPRLTKECLVTGATMAFRREYTSVVLPIGEGWVHDGWIAYIVSAFADVAAIDQDLIEYRQHSRQQIGAPPGNTVMGYRPKKEITRIAVIAYEWLNGCSASQVRAAIERELVRYRAAAERMQAFEARLRIVDSGYATQPEKRHILQLRPEARAELDNHLKNLAARHQIRSCRRLYSRVASATAEWRRGGYRHSSMGWLSFVRDLVGL